ncbi:MAG: hypothetical protein WCX31_15340 [Salinivirgaceae bacterium]
MDLQTRKLNVIEYLIGLKDEKIFQKIESTVFHSMKVVEAERSIKPFTQKQMVERANQSNQDYRNGNIKTQEELEKESQNW